MKKMKMSDVEIMDYYDAAVDKEKAIDALAVKCRMTRTMMRDKLGELGVLIDAPEVARHTHTHTHTPRRLLLTRSAQWSCSARDLTTLQWRKHSASARRRSRRGANECTCSVLAAPQRTRKREARV